MAQNTLDIRTMQREMEQCWTQKFADFENRLSAAKTAANPSLEQLQEEFIAFKTVVTKMLQFMGQQIRDNMKVIDSIDMRSRRKVLLFNGIPEDPEVEDECKILELLQNKMGLSHISSTSFKRCHRLGMRGRDQVRPVLVHFYNHQTKAEVWSSKSKLKGSPVSLSEFLTKSRQLLHKRARKHFGMHNVWTLDGSINIKLPCGERIRICTDEELNPQIAKYPSAGQQIVESATSVGSNVPSSGKSSGKAVSSISQPDGQRKQAGSHSDDTRRARRAAPKK